MSENKSREISLSIIFIMAITVVTLSFNLNMAYASTTVIENQIIKVKDGSFDDSFGFSVSLSADGTTALIGAPFHDGIAKRDTGAAYFFQKDKNDNWKKIEKVEPSDPRIQLYGGSATLSSDGSVALVGNILYSSIDEITVARPNIPKLIRDSDGSYYLDMTGTSTYAYKKDSMNRWYEIANLIPNSKITELHNNFGRSTSLSNNGTIALIGAHSSDILGPNSGIVSVFETNSNLDWTETAKLSPSELTFAGSFGYSVAISSDGRTALIGSKSLESGSNTNTVYVFEKDQNNWTETAKLSPSEPTTNSHFGYSVAISSDGRTALIGSPSLNSAHVFDLKLEDYVSSISNTDIDSDDHNLSKIEPIKSENTLNSDGIQTSDLQSFSGDMIVIPDWIKNNAKWWSDGHLKDGDFISGISFLINEKIMEIPETKIPVKDGSEEIPVWIKNNAAWWSQELITDEDFLKGIQYLVENGVIRID